MSSALYEGLLEVPIWAGFLVTAREIFACDHASVVIGLPRDGQNEPLVLHDDAPPAAVAELCRPDAGQLIVDEATILTPATAQGQLMILPVADDCGRAASIVLWRAGSRPGFDATAQDLLGSLAGPLRQNLKIYYRIVDLERRQIVFNAALETSNIGVILVDFEGQVLLTNPIAEELLAEGGGLQRTKGRLRASTPAETATLMEHVRHQAAEQSAEANWQVYAPIALPRAGHVLPLTVIVRPGPAFRPLKRPLRRTAMLILRDPGRQPILPAATLARLFGLTPAESLLASELAGGASLDEAAAAIGISRNTVRSQLQGIFMKTGTNRQAELVRMLLSSAAASS